MPERKGGARAILFICDFNAHGGTQTHLLHLLGLLDRSRFRPTLATLNLHPELARRLHGLDVEVINLELEGALRLATLRKAFFLASRVRRERVSLLHGCLFQGNLLTAVVSVLSRAPCVTSVRNLDLWKSVRHRLLSGAAHRRASRIVFNSRAVREATVARERLPLAKTVVIHNGVEDLAPRGVAAAKLPGRPTAICVASLLPKKDHVHLMDAFARVVSQVPDARLLLVGEGPLKANLQHHARRLGLADAVQFAGYQVDVAGLLKGADLFVLSSLEEGMPNALLEAMSAGLPSVVTNVGGMAETIEDGRGGYLVPPERPELLAERWCALLRDPDLRMRMGAEARRRYETGFTLQRMAGAYQTLYDELIGP